MTTRVAAIIPAAGLGTRLRELPGGQTPKATRRLAGRGLVRHAADMLAPLVDVVVVAAPSTHVDVVRRQLTDLPRHVTVVSGAATRQGSVRRALELVPEDCERLLVHDAARPLVPAAVAVRVLAALAGGAAAVVPVVPVADTLRAVHGAVSTPLDRSTVRAVQTPQGFLRSVLVEAHAAAAEGDATDDAGLVERRGHAVTLVEGDPLGFKITRPLDLLVAEAALDQADLTPDDPQLT